MLPEKTHMESRFESDPDIKALFLDIYGTILISASGDIEELDISVENLKKALDASGIKVNVAKENEQDFFIDILGLFKEMIEHSHRTEKTADMPFPEVDIPLIWERIMKEQEQKGRMILNGPLCSRCFTFYFELLSNAVSPMPGMNEVIHAVKNKGIPLGIISNAQFYTPVILNFFLNKVVTESERVQPFDEELTVFSYEFMRSKPDPYLFETAKSRCFEKYQIQPHQILFAGNDMFRDIYPARKAGFKTALFAGDKRSLRLRADKTEVRHIRPDYIINDLYQILKIIP